LSQGFSAGGINRAPRVVNRIRITEAQIALENEK
jgi:hypothetical protein